MLHVLISLLESSTGWICPIENTFYPSDTECFVAGFEHESKARLQLLGIFVGVCQVHRFQNNLVLFMLTDHQMD